MHQVGRFSYKYKRRLARLPHESALIYVVGFSVWFRFAPETNQSYVFYCSTCFRSITYYGPVDTTPSACSRELQFPPRQAAAPFAQRNSLNSWRQRCSVLMHQAWPSRGCLRGSFGLRNFEMLPLRVFIFYKISFTLLYKAKPNLLQSAFIRKVQ